MRTTSLPVVSKKMARFGIILSFVLGSATQGAGLPEPATMRVDEAPGLTVVDTLVPIEGFRLNFRIIKGGSPIILLEAGGGMDLTEWDDLAPRLARRTGATVVSYDRAGFGKSDLPEHPCEMEAEARWMWKCMRYLGFGKDVILVGHSYGGWMIRIEASQNPEAVSGMVFIDPFSTELVDLVGVEFLDQHPMAGKLPFDTSEPEKLTKLQRAQVRMVAGGLGPKTATMRETVVPAGIPVFIIKSALPFISEEGVQEAWSQSIERTAASIEGSVLVVAEESDHMIPFRQPDLVIDTVSEAIRLAGFE
jgi:pimeloyl-ACP methyl ester carboxylesterase